MSLIASIGNLLVNKPRGHIAMVQTLATERVRMAVLRFQPRSTPKDYCDSPAGFFFDVELCSYYFALERYH